MKKKRIFIIGILLIILTLLFTGCSVRKTVRLKEVKEFSKSILKSNEKIKELDFYFIRPYLGANLVYDGDLEKEDLKDLLDEFKTLIDIDFMQMIGEKCWYDSTAWWFQLDVFIDKKTERKPDYQIMTEYNKRTGRRDEEPDNIDGFKTWYIEDKDYNEILINGVKDESNNNWGIQLIASNITPTGVTLECKQLDIETTGDLQTSSYYFLEEEVNGEWIGLETLPPESEIVWDDTALIVTMKDIVVWNIDWEWLYGELRDGNYRIGKEIKNVRDTINYDTKTYYANFEVTN